MYSQTEHPHQFYRLATWATRRAALAALKSVKQSYPRAKVLRVEITATPKPYGRRRRVTP